MTMTTDTAKKMLAAMYEAVLHAEDCNNDFHLDGDAIEFFAKLGQESFAEDWDLYLVK